MSVARPTAYLLLLVSTGLAALKAAAQTEFSGTVTVTSDYRFRGLSQDARLITPQAELDWNGRDGWSAGLFAAKVDFQDHENTSLEVDLFGGKHFTIDETDLALITYYYAYPNHQPGPGSPRYSTIETNAKFSRQWDAIGLSAAIAWSPNFLANGEAWDVEIGASYTVTPWLTVGGHLGQQWEERWNRLPGSGFPYGYGDVGLTANADAWSLDLRYNATTLSSTQCLMAIGGANWCESGFVVSLSYAFGHFSD